MLGWYTLFSEPCGFYVSCDMTEDGSYFLGNVTSPVLVQKNATVTAYLLELP